MSGALCNFPVTHKQITSDNGTPLDALHCHGLCSPPTTRRNETLQEVRETATKFRRGWIMEHQVWRTDCWQEREGSGEAGVWSVCHKLRSVEANCCRVVGEEGNSTGGHCLQTS
uniref:Uncharacterized protein n=1 Tax=Trichobilharzia regenti TaxID=157069 RepID=A0AA85KGV6_TRIRE|nr:unnamed protein product [Trichobilharzia regenti]CAH8851061.1 unnamed protein product [Trichobilharzia regenti]